MQIVIRSRLIFKEIQVVRTDSDSIGNLVDLPRLIFIDKEYWNLNPTQDEGWGGGEGGILTSRTEIKTS